MKRTFIILLIALVCGCQQGVQPAFRYYAPANYILGLDQEILLQTEHGTLDITPHGDVADVLFKYQGLEVDDPSIGAFSLDIPGVSYSVNGDTYSLNADAVEGVIGYTLIDYVNGNLGKKTGTLTRSFSVSGSVNQKNLALSSVSISTTPLSVPLTLSIQKMVSDESAATFGQPGSPSLDGGQLNTQRVFVNDSGHDVAIRYLADGSLFKQELTIKAGNTGKYVLLGEADGQDSMFIITFEDGKVSKHRKSEKAFEYAGLPAEVKPAPLLFFSRGIIYYEKDNSITYTITPEIYTYADYPEE